MSADDYDADMLLMHSGIPSAEGERYRQEANRLLRVMSFKEAQRQLSAMYQKLHTERGGFHAQP